MLRWGTRLLQHPCPAAASAVAVLAVLSAPAQCGNAVYVYSSVSAISAAEAAVQARSVARLCVPRLPIAAFVSVLRSVQNWNCSNLGHAWVALQQLSMAEGLKEGLRLFVVALGVHAVPGVCWLVRVLSLASACACCCQRGGCHRLAQLRQGRVKASFQWAGSGFVRSLLPVEVSAVFELVHAVSCMQLAQASAARLAMPGSRVLGAMALVASCGSQRGLRPFSVCVLLGLRLSFPFGFVLGLRVLCCRLGFARFSLSALHILSGVLHLVLHSLRGGFAPCLVGG